MSLISGFFPAYRIVSDGLLGEQFLRVPLGPLRHDSTDFIG